MGLNELGTCSALRLTQTQTHHHLGTWRACQTPDRQSRSVSRSTAQGFVNYERLNESHEAMFCLPASSHARWPVLPPHKNLFNLPHCQSTTNTRISTLDVVPSCLAPESAPERKFLWPF